ncbi:hypothetical protein ACL9RF_15785 [Sphingobacterium sp. Mn56C]|uniref:hypothetical protein n=1 Tax=Sphingobacterium sp. Mn56C TaxID=3395261 RepID=UPI003BC645FC
MGIRYEKDTILNWVNEMGKFLRLLVEKWEGLAQVGESENKQDQTAEAGYKEFFGEDKTFFATVSEAELMAFLQGLDPKQIRPLALVLMYDGFLNQDPELLKRAKFVFDANSRLSGAFSFEDYKHLAAITAALKQ